MKEMIINKINSLDTKEQQLLGYKLKMLLNARGAEVTEKPRRLVAYIKPKENFEMEAFTTHLKERLPEYMIPTTINTLEDFPVLPNGKIDKAALKSLSPTNKQQHLEMTASGSETERKLIAIWEEVLDFSPVLPTDNFFEIGGDSILSIQIVAKARKAGIQLNPNQLFENQTIAELALFAKDEVKETLKAHFEGELPLTPVQHWFFELHRAAPHFWNQIMEISASRGIEAMTCNAIISTIVDHHEALRLSFQQQNDSWTASVLNKKDSQYFFKIDLNSAASPEEQEIIIREHLLEIQAACDLSKGGLFKCVYFDTGTIAENSIFLIAHHLVTDMISWNILRNDFLQLMQLARHDKPLLLEHKITTIKDWADELNGLKDAPGIKEELPYWLSQKCSPLSFPADFEDQSKIYEEASISTLKWTLDEEVTSYLLNAVHELYNTRTEDLLLTALLETICSWSGREQLCFLMEKHGRTADVLKLDVSDTVGWFTAVFPVELKYINTSDHGEQIKSVKEQMRGIPNNGIGYGILKYLSEEEDIRSQLQQEPQIVFNYLGRQNNFKSDAELSFSPLAESTRHPDSERNYGIEVNSYVSEGQLTLQWSYSKKLYKQATIAQLSKDFEIAIKGIIEYCQEKGSGEYTPSDFPEANISQEDLDNLLKRM